MNESFHPTPSQRLESEIEKSATGRIIACIGPLDSYPDEDQKWLRDLPKEHVDYFTDIDTHRSFNQRSSGSQTYVISEPNENHKASDGYQNCTGIVAVGVDKVTGRNISVLSHQDPSFFLRRDLPVRLGKFFSVSRATRFRRDFESTLKDFYRRVKPETIDVVLFGGVLSPLPSVQGGGKTMHDDYQDSITTLSSSIKRILGKVPDVVVGPNETAIAVRVVFDTERRRLYMYRPDQPLRDYDTINSSRYDKDREA